MAGTFIVEAKALRKTYRRTAGGAGAQSENRFVAIDAVDLDVAVGETLAIVGGAGADSLLAVAQIATRIAVMNAGRIAKLGSAEQALRAPQHPYTRELLFAVPEVVAR